MIKINKFNTALILILSITACNKNAKPTLPALVTNKDEAAKLIVGKKWQVVDVATVSGSYKPYTKFAADPFDSVTIPAPAKLNWFSAIKKVDTTTNSGKFFNENFTNYKKIIFNLNNDSIAKITGQDSTKQTYTINQNTRPNTFKGLNLCFAQLISTSAFGNMKTLATYYILGATENTLLLLTPNEYNEEDVVFFMETK